MRILLLEDERRIADFVRNGLTEQGFQVEHVDHGDRALERILNEPFDAAILDIMVPGRDGLAVLRAARSAGRSLPVLLLTARDGLDDRVDGFEVGADDYLTKPFYVEELVVRLRALIRRSGGQPAALVQSGSWTLDTYARRLRGPAGEEPLTRREFTLLEYLMRSPGRVFTRTQILERVWGYDFDPETNLVDACVQRLRKKLGEDEQGSPIESIRGVGYRFRQDAP